MHAELEGDEFTDAPTDINVFVQNHLYNLHILHQPLNISATHPEGLNGMAADVQIYVPQHII